MSKITDKAFQTLGYINGILTIKIEGETAEEKLDLIMNQMNDFLQDHEEAREQINKRRQEGK